MCWDRVIDLEYDAAARPLPDPSGEPAAARETQRSGLAALQEQLEVAAV